MARYQYVPLNNNVEEMFIGPFGSSLKNDAFVEEQEAFCMVYEQKHAIKKTMDVETRYVNREKYDELKRFNIKGGDIIVSCRGTIGETYIVPEDAPLGIMHPSIMKIRLKPGVYNKRYFNLLLRNYLKRHEDEANGSGIKMAISAKELGATNFPVPNMEEQNQIAITFDKVDELISFRKEQLAKLDELVKARFVEMFGTVKNNHHKYPVVKVGKCAKLQGGFAFKSSDYLDDGIRLVQISNVNKDALDWDSINCVPYTFLQKYKDFELHIGDLVLAMTRPVIKSLDAVKIAAVSEDDVPSLLNQRVGRFVVDKSKLNALYLMLCCQMTEFKEYVESMSGNSLQPNISSKQVENYTIVLPPLDLQEQFADSVEQTNKTKVEVQKSLDELEILKKSLMQKYFG